MGEAEEVQEKMKADMEAMKEQMATMMEAMKSTEGQAVGGIPFENTLEGPQFRPQPQPLHFAVGRAPPAMAEKGKADHLKERLRAIEEKMATMMEAMMSVKKIMEANAVTIAATSVVAKVNPTSPSGLKQMNHPTLGMEVGGQAALERHPSWSTPWLTDRHGYDPT